MFAGQCFACFIVSLQHWLAPGKIQIRYIFTERGRERIPFFNSALTDSESCVMQAFSSGSNCSDNLGALVRR